jgi:cytochrome d ubiquinol oxidase subunit I
MIGLGLLSMAIAVVGLWLTRKGNIALPKWAWGVAIWAAPLPVLGTSIGWMFTEMGRQPWIVFRLMKTSDAVSPGITGLDVLISLIAFTSIYAILAVVEFRLLLAAAQAGPPEEEKQDEKSDELSIAY